MAAGEAEKSRGLKFAEQQLLRHGWEHGNKDDDDDDDVTPVSAA